MSAIFKREFKTYFTSPIGYCVLALMFGLTGLFFILINVGSGTAELSYLFSNLMSYMLILVLPILTMRLMSDEKRQKTDQALLTAPVGLVGIVCGKFLAALLLFAIGCSMTLICAVIVAVQVTPDWLVIFGNYFGLLLLGGMVIAIGMLISSLTESQFLAALGTFLASILLILLDSLGALFSSSKFLTSVIQFLSISGRYSNFTSGVIQYDDIVFFLSMQVLFLFVTVRLLDRKRWN